MNEEQKQYIEQHIDLIEDGSWDEFFKKAPEGTGGVLYEAEIDFMSKMKHVPSHCFYLSSLTNITIPDGVTSIIHAAFNYSTNLISVTIPDSVIDIGYNAFYHCSSLKSITIPDRVTNIHGYAFCECSSLTSVVIGNGVTSIDEYVFCDCTSLTSIEIPDSVTSIGIYAFHNCNSLKSITLPNSITTINEGAFNDLGSDVVIKFNGTKEQFKKIYNSEAFKDTYFTVNCLDGTLHKKKG